MKKLFLPIKKQNWDWFEIIKSIKYIHTEEELLNESAVLP